MVEELLARADKAGSTPGDAVFCFFVYRFFSLSLFGLSFPKSLKYILIQVHDQQVQGSAVRIKKKKPKGKKKRYKKPENSVAGSRMTTAPLTDRHDSGN